MRFVSLLPVLAAAQGPDLNVGVSHQAYDASGGVQKVVNLLKKMIKTIDADMDRDKRVYDQFACFCKEEGAARGKAIEDAKDRLTELTGRISQESALIEEASNKIKEAESNIAKEKKAMGMTTKMMKKDDEDYSARKAAATETLNVVARGIGALSKPREKKEEKTAFLQSEEEMQVEKERKNILAFVEEMTGKSVGEGAMGQVIGYLNDLKKQTAVDLQADSQSNMQARMTYTESMLLSAQKIAQFERVVMIKKEQKAENMKLKGEDTEEYVAVKEKMDVDVAFFDNMTSDCDKRAAFYASNHDDAGVERDAVVAALPILENLISGSDFLQLKAMTAETSMLKVKSAKMSRAMLKMESKTRGAVLAMLAGTSKGRAALSATDKIVTKCESMITDLKSEIKTTEDNKTECNLVTQKLNMTVIKKTQEENDAQSAVDATEAAIEVQEERIAKTEKEIDENIAAHTKLDTQCTKAKATLNQNIIDLKADSSGVGSAIAKLTEVYGAEAVEALKEHQTFKADYNDKYGKMESDSQNTGKQHTEFSDQKKRRGGGAKIVLMLSTIKDNLDLSLEKTEAELKDTTGNCIVGLKDLVDAKLDLESIKTTQTGELSGLNMKLSFDNADLTTAQGNLDTAEQALSDYGNCAQRIHEYDQAIAAKTADIEGLQVVIQTLKSMSADTVEAVSTGFVQDSVSLGASLDAYSFAHKA